MGTLRWEKEDAERTQAMRHRSEFDQRRSALELVEADTRARIKALEHDLERQRFELAAYSGEDKARIVSTSDRETALRKIRSADPVQRAAVTTAPKAPRGSNGFGRPAPNKKEERDGH